MKYDNHHRQKVFQKFYFHSAREQITKYQISLQNKTIALFFCDIKESSWYIVYLCVYMLKFNEKLFFKNRKYLYFYRKLILSSNLWKPPKLFHYDSITNFYLHCWNIVMTSDQMEFSWLCDLNLGIKNEELKRPSYGIVNKHKIPKTLLWSG